MTSRMELHRLAAAVAAVFAVACDQNEPTAPSIAAPAAAITSAAVAMLSPEYCLVNTPLDADEDALASADPRARKQLATLRATVPHLRTPDDALASGFVPNATGFIQGAAGRGAFGRQFINIARAFDNVLDPSLPEVVAYEDQADGSTKFVNVFHTIPAGPGYTPIVASQFSGPPYPSPRPELYGRSFDGPLVQPGSGFVFWGLRVHVGRHNPKGMFHPYNPRISGTYSPKITIIDPLLCWFPE
jgi:hypothetical protein